MPRILLEDCHGEFLVDRNAIKLVSESSSGNVYDIPGRFSVIGQVNGNKRRYGRSVWDKNLAEGSALRTLLAANESFGLLEHPKDGIVDLTSNISHITTSVGIVGEELHGTIRIVKTPEGQKLMALIEGGWNPKVSSRGFGSLVKGPDGIDEVQDDFVCEGWDVVSKPSFANAVLTPNREALGLAPAPAPIVTEDVSKPKNTQPSAEAAPEKVEKIVEAQIVTNNKPTKIMDLKKIKESVRALKSVDASSVTPERFAEGLTQMSELHSELAEATGYDAIRLHREIEDVEKSWQEAAARPAKEAKSTKEANEKLLRVLKTLTETAVKMKKTLTKLTEDKDRQNTLSAEVARRGRGWKARCEESEKSRGQLAEKHEVACASLDKLAALYISDSTKFGQTLLNHEFPAILKENEVLAKALADAKHPAQVGRVRESIEKLSTPAPKTDGKKVTESVKDDKKVVEPKKKSDPVVELSEVQILASRPHHMGGMNESIALTQRLSKARLQVVG